MIELKNVNKKYDKLILSNINISFESGLIGILGSSGCGKSTLLNLISLLDNNYEGDIYFNNINYKDIHDKEKFRYENFGFVFQNYQLFNLLNVKDIIEFADTVNLEDVQDILSRQINCNMAIAREGIKNNFGANVGLNLLALYGDCLPVRARAMAAAGSDARMSGCSLPVVINSGSGNQGMTVTIPLVVYADEYKISQEKLYRALLVSNLLAIHQKKYIGKLSAFCGAVSAGYACGAAITYMLGGNFNQIANTIINTLANTSGIICDGAKPSCAAKISSALDAALLAHTMSMHDDVFHADEGIVKDDLEKTIRAVGYIGREGMKSTDIEVLNIMIDKVCP